jgi:hypothetical protein
MWDSTSIGAPYGALARVLPDRAKNLRRRARRLDSAPRERCLAFLLLCSLALSCVRRRVPRRHPVGRAGDGAVNGADLGLLLGAWGGCAE